jgi:hypothetical protein
MAMPEKRCAFRQFLDMVIDQYSVKPTAILRKNAAPLNPATFRALLTSKRNGHISTLALRESARKPLAFARKLPRMRS